MDSPLSPRALDICFMPELLPDELLYSFIGRMSAMNVLGNSRERLQLLFNADNLIPVVDLPTRLSYLQTALGRLSPWSSALELINKATVYPYHRPFLNSKRNAAVENILLDGSGKSLKTFLGRVANRFGAAPELRFCPICLYTDTHHYGVPYWHRAHQLPGVTACVTHNVSLVQYSNIRQRADRLRIVLAPGTFAVKPPIAEPNPQQYAFASLSNELLEACLPVLEGVNCQSVYRDAVFALGIKNKRYVDYPGLASAVRAYYCDFVGFPHQDRLLSTQRNPLSWLRTLIERPDRSSHPICHLLLIGFLFKTIEEFRGFILSKSPQACNPIASCMGPCRPCTPTTPDNRLLQDMTLSCREVARLTNRSVTTIVNKRRILGLTISERPKNRRADTTAQIVHMLEKGMAPRQIAVDCNASLSTIYRLRAQVSGAALEAAGRRFDEERDKRRRRWTELLAANTGNGPTAARKASAATYAWLYRNDRKWLQEKSTSFRVRRPHNARVDWAKRDIELCAIVRTHVANVRSRENRPRISRTLMTQHIGDANVRANLKRLPKLKAVMDELEESKLSYQRERIRLVIHDLLKIGQPISIWRIQRMAGVRTWTPIHGEFVNAIINQQRDTI